MRSTLLVSTAALLAGIGLASAQGMQGGQSGAAPSAQSQGAQGGAAGQERQSPQSSPSQRSGQAQQGQKEPMKKDTTGQAQRDQGAPAKADQDDKAQPQRSGQGQRDQQSPTQAQSPQRQQNQQGQAGQAPQQGAKGGSATLTTEQRTTIRKTVLSGSNVPRATNVNFSVSVGTTVPTSVRVVAVPSTLIEIYPEWRGHMYFVVNDEIIIVDRNHRIIAVLPV
jgi:DNA mismatch repair ATPase MutL